MLRSIATKLPTALLFAAAPAFAQVSVPEPGAGVPEDIGGFYELVCVASNWVFSFVMIIAVIVLLIGAFLFFTAGGNEDKLSTARRFVTYALVGIGIAVLARALVAVVGTFVGAPGGAGTFFAC